MNPNPTSCVRTLLLLSIACTTAAAQSVLSQHAQVVQAVGDPVAAIPGATIFATNNFDAPVMDQNGTVLYRARILGGGADGTNDRAFFMGRSSGDLQMVVRAGDQAPGCAPGTLLRNSSATTGSAGLGGSGAPLRISPFGEILYFASSLYDPVTPTPTTADTALFWGPVGGLMLLAREGDQVPFLGAGITYGSQSMSHQNNAINASGQVLFSTTLLGAVTTADDAVMVTGTPGNLTVVSREGDVLPGGEVVNPSSGTTMSFINQINEVGQVLHELKFATALPSTAITANDRALAVWTAGTDIIIAREGQQAPGLPAGVLFAAPAPNFLWNVNVSGSAFTKSGKTAILCQLDGGGTVVNTDDYAIYFGGISGLNLVLRRGDAAPGLPGVNFGVAGSAGLTCNEDDVAFVMTFQPGASVTTADDTSIWRGSNLGNLTMIAREGDLVPTSVLPATVNGPWKFNQFNTGSNSPQLNGRGDVMFQASVTETGAVTPVTKNVWLCNTKALGLQLVLDATDTFTTGLGSGGWTSISYPGIFGGGDGGLSHFNNQGDFVVKPGIAAPVVAAIVRGHIGSLIAEPSSISATAGGTQNWTINCGPAQANMIYIVIGSMSGTRPGFPSPLGPQTIPLNFDTWTQLTLDLANTGVFTNSLWFLDAQGKGTASFNLPPALPGAQGLNLHHAVVALDFNLASTFVSEPASLRLY